MKITFTLQIKVQIVKVMVFPGSMYEYESWAIKKAEQQRIDAFELWFWRTLLRVPWPAQRSNQSILKEINLEYSLEGLLLKLKLQYFDPWCQGLTHWKRPWCWERFQGKRRRRQQRTRWLDNITDSLDKNLRRRRWWRTKKPSVLQSMESQSIRYDLVTGQQQKPLQAQCLKTLVTIRLSFMSQQR